MSEYVFSTEHTDEHGGPLADTLKFMANLWIICDNSRSKTNRCDAKRLHLLSFFDNGDDLRWGHDFRCDGERVKGLKG